ncbi:hypothetical protein [Spirosoma pollinicola]|nr:hypothetical protein [Spirosoma pollinicola]
MPKDPTKAYAGKSTTVDFGQQLGPFVGRQRQSMLNNGKMS